MDRVAVILPVIFIEYLTENEGLYFLKLKNDQISDLYAGQMLSYAWWSYAISSHMGWVSDRFKRRKIPLQQVPCF